MSYQVITQKLHSFSLLLLAFIIPIPVNEKWLPAGVVFVLLTWLLEGDFKRKFRNVRHNKGVWLLPAYWGVFAISLLWSENLKMGWRELESLLSFLIFPIVLNSRPYIPKKEKNFIYLSFILGTLTLLVFSVFIVINDPLFQVKSLDNYISHFSLYIYTSLGRGGIHPSYLSLYLTISILFFLDIYSKNKQNNILSMKIISILFLIILIQCIGSRAALLTLVFIALSYMLLAQGKTKYFIITSLSILLLGMFFWAGSRTTYKLRQSRNKYEDLLKKDTRINIWINGLEVIKESPLYGVGIGDRTDRLFQKYKKNSFDNGLSNKLIAHNQFIENSIAMGIVGLIALIIILLIPLKYSWHNNQIYEALFSITIISNLFFESMLSKLVCIVLYSFFISLILNSNKKNDMDFKNLVNNFKS